MFTLKAGLTSLLIAFLAISFAHERANALPVEAAFGSVAISAPNNAFVAKWRAALAEKADLIFLNGCDSKELCQSPAFRALKGALESAASRAPLEKLQVINTAVNQAVRYTSDLSQYGVEDHWALARETLISGRGDCEDIAVLKMWMLRAAEPSRVCRRPFSFECYAAILSCSSAA